MPAQPEYPSGRYQPSARADLASTEERERLSPSALRVFFNIAECWDLRDRDARNLLGGFSSGTYYKWKREPNRTLDADTLTRISYLVGIFKGLNILYGETLADKWIWLPNPNRIFAGQAPLTYILAGGVPAMETVRRLLDARRG